MSFSPDGLFDISVTVGTDHANGVAVSGDIGGPTPTAVDNQHRVYLVAVPKNDALTMVISNGADLGFTLANNATVDQYGAVILSAGHDIVDGDIGGESAGSNAAANFWFTGAHATNNLFGEATGYADLYSTDAQASQMVTVFDSDVTVHAVEHVAMGASGAGTSLTVGGNLSLSTDAIAGFSGGSAQGGDTSLYAWNSGNVTITGDTLLTANAFGGSTESSGEAGGTGTGGKVTLQADPGGTLHIIGDVDLQAAKGISELGVAPRDVLAGEADDEGADLVGLAGSTGLAALLRAVVLLRDELPKPLEDGLRTNNLAAAFALLRCERLALHGQAMALLVGEGNALAPSGLRGASRVIVAQTSTWSVLTSCADSTRCSRARSGG